MMIIWVLFRREPKASAEEKEAKMGMNTCNVCKHGFLTCHPEPKGWRVNCLNCGRSYVRGDMRRKGHKKWVLAERRENMWHKNGKKGLVVLS
jgi:hypothetical protein